MAASPLYNIGYTRLSRQLRLSNVTIAVVQYELRFFQYWGGLMTSPAVRAFSAADWFGHTFNILVQGLPSPDILVLE